MVNVNRRSFREKYSDGHVAGVEMKVKAGENIYVVTCDRDPQSGRDTLLFEELEVTSQHQLGDTLDFEEITEVVALLAFCEQFAEEKGYDEFRGPRTDI